MVAVISRASGFACAGWRLVSVRRARRAGEVRRRFMGVEVERGVPWEERVGRVRFGGGAGASMRALSIRSEEADAWVFSDEDASPSEPTG